MTINPEDFTWFTPFTDTLIEARRRHGYTPEQVAERAGITPEQYLRIEQGLDGVAAISFRTGVGVCWVLGINPMGLLGSWDAK